MAQQSQETKPLSPKIKRQTSAKAGPVASTKPAAAAAATKPDENTKKIEAKPAAELVQAPAAEADVPKAEPRVQPLPEAEGVDDMVVDEADDAVEGVEELEPSLEEETVMEETIRVTRAKLRRRAAVEASA
jgi:receptor expression-enhancing protein 1/2/3/4